MSVSVLRVHWILALALLTTLIASVTAHAANTFTVSQGMSIQSFLDKAEPGDTVQVLPGTYHEELTVTKDNITLTGMSYEGQRTILNGTENVVTLDQGILVSADNVTVDGFVVRDFAVGGVGADNVANLTLSNLIIRSCGSASILLDDIKKLTVKRVVAGEASAAAIIILDSSEVAIADSEALLSPYGLVLWNCVKTLVENSTIHQNAIGAVIAGTPDSSKDPGNYTTITHSRFLSNAGENTFGAGSTLKFLSHLGELPGGLGIVILGADSTDISGSIIARNGSCGAATYSYPDSPEENEDGTEEIVGVPDHTFFHRNTYADNGDAPSAAYSDYFPGVAPGDLYWDGKGMRNQWQESTNLKTHPEGFVVEQGGVHTDVIRFL